MKSIGNAIYISMHLGGFETAKDLLFVMTLILLLSLRNFISSFYFSLPPKYHFNKRYDWLLWISQSSHLDDSLASLINKKLGLIFRYYEENIKRLYFFLTNYISIFTFINSSFMWEEWRWTFFNDYVPNGWPSIWIKIL